MAGQVALDESGELVGPGDGLARSRQVFANLRSCLAEAGATFADVVKLTYYVTDIGILPRCGSRATSASTPSGRPRAPRCRSRPSSGPTCSSRSRRSPSSTDALA
ncbi:MAG: RidA family protein [Acidothermales bacterium]|nr:RidA family protein [Acidothermales bacterium]